VFSTIAGLKTESTPGPNGFTVTFFKKLWLFIKKGVFGCGTRLQQGLSGFDKTQLWGDYSGTKSQGGQHYQTIQADLPAECGFQNLPKTID
jgi:hypothetical protein